MRWVHRTRPALKVHCMQITLMKAEPDIYYAILKRLRQNANKMHRRKGDLIKNAFNFRQREAGKEEAS